MSSITDHPRARPGSNPVLDTLLALAEAATLAEVIGHPAAGPLRSLAVALADGAAEPETADIARALRARSSS